MSSSNPQSRHLVRPRHVALGAILGAFVAAQQISGTLGSPSATTSIDGRYLPPPPAKFGAEINLNAY